MGGLSEPCRPHRPGRQARLISTRVRPAAMSRRAQLVMAPTRAPVKAKAPGRVVAVAGEIPATVVVVVATVAAAVPVVVMLNGNVMLPWDGAERMTPPLDRDDPEGA